MASLTDPTGDDEERSEEQQRLDQLGSTLQNFTERASAELGLYLVTHPTITENPAEGTTVGQFVFEFGERAYRDEADNDDAESKRLMDRFELDLIEDEIRQRLGESGEREDT